MRAGTLALAGTADSLSLMPKSSHQSVLSQGGLPLNHMIGWKELPSSIRCMRNLPQFFRKDSFAVSRTVCWLLVEVSFEAVRHNCQNQPHALLATFGIVKYFKLSVLFMLAHGPGMFLEILLNWGLYCFACTGTCVHLKSLLCHLLATPHHLACRFLIWAMWSTARCPIYAKVYEQNKTKQNKTKLN